MQYIVSKLLFSCSACGDVSVLRCLSPAARVILGDDVHFEMRIERAELFCVRLHARRRAPPMLVVALAGVHRCAVVAPAVGLAGEAVQVPPPLTWWQSVLLGALGVRLAACSGGRVRWFSMAAAC